MPPRNPSELARLEDELDFWKQAARNSGFTKTARELALVEVRKLEAQLGLESKPYNSNEF